MCCCNMMHVTTGSFVIGIVAIALSLMYLLQCVLTQIGAQLVANIICVLVSVTLAIILIYGVKKSKPAFVLAYFIFMMIEIAYYVIMLIVLIAALALITTMSNDDHTTKDANQLALSAGIIACFLMSISLVLFLWFAVVIYKCYKYLSSSSSIAASPFGSRRQTRQTVLP
ncbi:unnamed protein product, partial [Soboliphyme baturini]|uniref:MARVEL domain-containing protein n=1 Tax=Soboliphyme baturini TaxID=241478 RepID=A0A183I9X6_9BILA